MLRREAIYLLAVLALLSVAWLWREGVVKPQARKLALLEEEIGNVEVAGRALELALTGSRGLAVSYLWFNVTELQKKNRWNEMELLTRSLTKLQPHFITPWLFQSWNFAYNVYAELDRPREKLYYLSLGCQMLAEGEKRNRFNPDLRYNIGFYLQHKINQSDETNVNRSLFQLANIHPAERDPLRFQVFDDKGQEVRWTRFDEVRQQQRQKRPEAEWLLRLRLANQVGHDTILKLAESAGGDKPVIPDDLPATPLELTLAWMDQTEQGSTGLPLITGPGAWSSLVVAPLLLNRHVSTPDGRLIPETDFARFRSERDAQADASIAGYRRAKGADMEKFLALPVAATREAQAARQARIDSQASSSAEEKLLARLDRAERELVAFCEKYPAMVRRLREGLRPEFVPSSQGGGRGRRIIRRTQFTCENADSLVKFFSESLSIPSVYDIRRHVRPAPNEWRMPENPVADILTNPIDRFPLLPVNPDRSTDKLADGSPVNKEWDPGAQKRYTDIRDLGEDFDAWAAAMAWYRYALEPVPPPGELPGETRPIENRVAQHRPKNLATLLFRTQPGLMQGSIVKRLQQEGWYDADPGDNDPVREGTSLALGGGYVLSDWIPGRKLTIGKDISWMQAALVETDRVWRKIAQENHLQLDPVEELNLDRRAMTYRMAYLVSDEMEKPDTPEKKKAFERAIRGAQPRHTQPEEGWSDEMKASWKAHLFLKEFDIYRQMSNFPSHYARALGEINPAARIARKRFYEADTLARFQPLANERDALRIYRKPDAFVAWREKVLLRDAPRQGWFSDTTLRVLSDYGKDESLQEESYTIDQRYRQLAEEQEESVHAEARRDLGTRMADIQFASALLGATGGGTGYAAGEVGLMAGLYRHFSNPREPAPFNKMSLVAPFLDYLDETDYPEPQQIISESAKNSVEGRNGALNTNRPKPGPLPPR